MPSALSRLVFFLFLRPIFAIAQSNRNVSVGETLTPDEADAPWLSESGDFAFGFHQLNDKDHFLLAIWYHKIPDKTIVWYPNETNKAPRGSKVELTAERGLVLKNPQNQNLWSSQLTGGAVAYGILNDTGNFILKDEGSKSLWESFKYPRDTLLPTQIMERGGILSSGRRLNYFSRGRFQFQLLEDGNAVRNTVNLASGFVYDSYFSSDTYKSTNESNAGYRVIFHESGYLYIERTSGERKYITEEGDIDPSSTYYYKATINYDGVFTISRHSKNPTDNDSWSDIRIIPDNICNVLLITPHGSGACGFNSLCLIGDDKRPSCDCPSRFSRIENDPDGSCKPDFSTDCEDQGKSPPEALYDWVELTSTAWFGGDYEKISPSNIGDCKRSCLDDCLCTVAIYDGNNCRRKKLPLSNGVKGSRTSATTFLKVRKNKSSGENLPSPQVPNAKDQDTLIIGGSILLGSSVFLNFLFVGTICSGFLIYFKKKINIVQRDEGVAERNLRNSPTKS